MVTRSRAAAQHAAPRPRVVALVTDRHLGSAALLHHLLANRSVDLAGVVIARSMPLSRRELPRIARYALTVGPRFLTLIGLQVLLQRLAFATITLIDRRHRRIGSTWRALRRSRIPILRVKDVNGPESTAFLVDADPEVLLSLYFNQILRPGTLELASRAAINLHPSLLPAYRGLMSYFWVLRNGERQTGVTIHRMTERVDAGPILRQRAFSIDPAWTQHDVLFEATRLGALLLDDVLEDLARGGSGAADSGADPAAPRERPRQVPSYYSFPTGTDLRAYGHGRPFVAPATIFRYLWRTGLQGGVPSGRSSGFLEGGDHGP